jgi:hypothetical protein
VYQPLCRYGSHSVLLQWVLCAAALVVLASMGNSVSPTTLVIMLTLANLGYVAADVAADGMMVSSAGGDVSMVGVPLQ